MPNSASTFKLGRYDVIGRIAIGGMATVYRARLGRAGGFSREFALKVVHPHLCSLPGFVERFLDEARVASRVHHPNCVATVDVEEDRGWRFLVLELIDGITLRQLQLARTAPLAADEAARVVADAARGLHAVHEIEDDRGEQLDVIHRDVSPHNLMLDVGGRTVLIDLGLAKARGQLGHTQTGVLAGRLPYMSPEQSRLEPLDARSDVFSLGSVLFELVTGRAPFGEDHTPGTLERLRTCDRPALARALEERAVPQWLAVVILACLNADREARIADAVQLAEALEQELHRLGRDDADVRGALAVHARSAKDALGPEAPAVALPPLLDAPPRRRGGRWIAAAAAVAVVIGAAIGLAQLPAEPDAPRRSDPVEPTLSTDVSAPALAPASVAGPTPPPPAEPAAARPDVGVPEPAPPPRPRRSSAARRPALKHNPYPQ